jgi:hypothetical protein
MVKLTVGKPIRLLGIFSIFLENLIYKIKKELLFNQ